MVQPVHCSHLGRTAGGGLALRWLRLDRKVIDGRELLAAGGLRPALHGACNAETRALPSASQPVALAECVHETQPFPIVDNRFGE
jgi:hypothetical protein